MSNERIEDKNEKKEKNKCLIIICIIAAIIIIILLSIIIFMIGSKTSANESEVTKENKKRSVVVMEENAEEIAEQIINQTEPEGIPLHYQVTMNSIWEFENGQGKSRNAYVANSNDNETPVYFDIMRNDTQEIIYESPIIPIGQSLSNITLNEELDAGNYECTLTYHLIDDEQNTLTTVNMWLMIVVES